MKLCSVDGCERKHHCKGYCDKHYHQIYKFGNILERTIRDTNELIIVNDVCLISLYNQQCIEIAKSKFYVTYYNILKDYKWRLDGHGYAVSDWYDDNGRYTMSLHAAIIELSGQIVPYGHEIDHKDGDKLNNLDENLRICTSGQNKHNRGKNKNNTSGFKGVVWCKSSKNWRSQIMINNNPIHLGYFNGVYDAAKAYNTAAIKYHGEFAHLNDI